MSLNANLKIEDRRVTSLDKRAIVRPTGVILSGLYQDFSESSPKSIDFKQHKLPQISKV